MSEELKTVKEVKRNLEEIKKELYDRRIRNNE